MIPCICTGDYQHWIESKKGEMRKPCCAKEGTNKGAWSKDEDQKLINYIKVHGEGCWHSVPKAAGLERCGKSCRLRWTNYLRPDIKRGNFAQDEEDLIIKLHALLGNRWSLIAGRLPGRTDNEVKNYWNSHIRKKLIRMGIDPNNHKLHQHLRCRKTPQQTPISFTANSSESKKNNASGKQLPSSKSQGKNHANDQDATSEDIALRYIKEETSQILNLNLELRIAMPLDPGK